jgi:conjugal transfer ATP-binding protein TraC
MLKALFGNNRVKLPEIESWSKAAPWRGVGARVFDPNTNLFYSVSEAGEPYLCASWECDALIGASDSTVEKLKSGLNMTLPGGTFIQFGTFMVPNIEPYVGAYLDGKMAVDKINPVLAAIIRNRYQMLLSAQTHPIVEASGVLSMIRRLFITMCIPVSGAFSEQDRARVVELTDRFASALKTAGLNAHRLGAGGYLAMMRMLTHPFSKREDWYDESRLLNEQIFQPGDGYDVHRSHLHFSDGEKEWYAKPLTTKFFPTSASLGIMNNMIGDPGGLIDQFTHPYWMTLTLHFPDRTTKMAELQQKFAMISHQAVGGMTDLVPLLRHKKHGFDVLMDSLSTGGGSVVEANFNIWLYNPSLSAIKNQAASLAGYFSTIGFDIKEDGLICDHLWKMSLPGGATTQGIKQMHRYHTMAVVHAVNFLPIIGEWQGSGPSGAMMFTSRRGAPVLFDMFEATSFNAVIFAETGAGKSVASQTIITDYLAEGAKVWCIDVGYSYKKLCHAIDGHFISFNDDSGICLNPFTHVVNIDDDADLIKAMLAKMAAPEEGLDDFRMAVLEEAVKSTWARYGNQSSVTAVAEWCLSQEDVRIQDIGKQLYPFTRFGSYGRWFDGDNNLDLDRYFVVLELEEIKSRPGLQKVILIQLMGRIGYEMYRVGDRRKLFVIDEAWSLLDDPVMAKAIEAAYRKIRKANGSMLICTQSIADLYNSPNGRAISQNTAWQIILQQKAESIDNAIETGQFHLDPYGARMLKMVHTAKGKYSEMMIRRSGAEYGVVRLCLDRFSQVLYSTSGAERNEILNAIDRGEDVVEVINRFIENEDANA